MGSSSKDTFRPPADQPAPSGQMTPTPGGGAPAWNSILPVGNGPAQLSDPFRTEPGGPPAPSPSAPISTPPAGAATSAAGPTTVPAAVANLPPAVQREYMAAKAAGNDELAARILLAATMQSPVARNADRSGGAPAGSGPGPGWGGGVAGGIGGRSSGGIY